MFVTLDNVLIVRIILFDIFGVESLFIVYVSLGSIDVSRMSVYSLMRSYQQAVIVFPLFFSWARLDRQKRKNIKKRYKKNHPHLGMLKVAAREKTMKKRWQPGGLK